jgi:uncharacterized protein
MISLLAPSKTMDFSPVDMPGFHYTTPVFQSDAKRIVSAVQKVQDESTLAELMHVSAPIAKATKQKYQDWGKTVGPSIYSYTGDIYKGFYARTLSASDIQWAQEHLVVASGVYGILRPLDLISPYRLEMKTKLKIGDTSDLYEFWGDKLAQFVDERAGGIICNIASDEYGKAVTKFTKSRVVTPVFLDKRPDGRIGTVPIYSKMMRGVMARWIIDHRIDDPAGLVEFSAQGYRYDASRSIIDRPAFYRKISAPIRVL